MKNFVSAERIGAAITSFRERVLGLAKWRPPQFRKASASTSAPGTATFWQRPSPAPDVASAEEKPRHVVIDCSEPKV